MQNDIDDNFVKRFIFIVGVENIFAKLANAKMKVAAEVKKANSGSKKAAKN